MLKSLEIVTSARNEALNLEELYSRIKDCLDPLQVSWTLLISDNASHDETWQVVDALASQDSRVRSIRLSRDFGFESSIFAAMQQTTGHPVLIMASDLQDPPEFIPLFLKKYAEGFDHIYQIVEARPKTSIIRRINSALFYKLSKRLTDGLVVENSSTFRLISPQVASAIIALPERTRFIRALVNYVGFTSIGIKIPREARPRGVSKANTSHVVGLAIKGTLSNSYQLLNWVGILGVLVSSLATICAFVFATIWITQGVPFAGFGTIVGLLLLGFGITLLCMGIIAQYVALIYEEVKQRPHFLIRERTDNLLGEL